MLRIGRNLGCAFPLSYLNSPFSGSLLKEAEFHAEQREHELNRRRQLGLSSSHHSLDNADFDNKDDDKHDQRLLSQFGIWFLVRKRHQPLLAFLFLILCCIWWGKSPLLLKGDNREEWTFWTEWYIPLRGGVQGVVIFSSVRFTQECFWKVTMCRFISRVLGTYLFNYKDTYFTTNFWYTYYFIIY